MPSETTTEAQDATVGMGDTLHLGVPSGPLEELAAKLTTWQHFVFNTSQRAENNRVGIANVAHEIQVAAYELRVLLGQGELEAKLGAGMLLSPEEQRSIEEREEEDRRAAAVAQFQHGLR
jgi:hypothetical protein